MPLPDASRVRALALPSLGAGDDDKIDLMIAAADAALAQRCLFPRTSTGATTLEAASYVQYYHGPDRDPRQLTLGLRPVTVTALDLDTGEDLSYADSLDVADDIVVDQHRGLVYLKPAAPLPFVCGPRAIRVTATAGWDVAEEPPLVQAIALLVSQWNALGTTGLVLDSVSTQGSSAGFRDPRVPAVILDLLAPYRLWEREGWSGR